MSERGEFQTLDDCLRSFLGSNPHPEQLEALERLLNARPAFSTPQKSDLEATKDQRYEYALKIQAQVRRVPSSQIKVGKDENGKDKFEPFRLDATHVSIILLIPMSALEEGGWLDFSSSTHTSHPRVTSILPSSWNDELDTVYFTSAVMEALYAFFSEDMVTELYSLLANLAKLGLFGLYCKGIAPCAELDEPTEMAKVPFNVTIQFNWLRRGWEKPNHRIALEGDDNEFMKMAERQIKHELENSPPYKDNHGARIAAVRADINIPLLSGQEFIITMPREDAVKCKFVLDLQWPIVQIAGMGGAAGYPDLLPDHDGWIKDRLFWE
ncbi:transcription factor [Fusarium flagelliforme]|uniref:Transcription factor n=1 Tax=Fusarium flagelliforme TaxID=2675880 RepID=A0A395MWL0_9HYPO|nr:transcription factor [Fusarium flagelliforme]